LPPRPPVLPDEVELTDGDPSAGAERPEKAGAEEAKKATLGSGLLPVVPFSPIAPPRVAKPAAAVPPKVVVEEIEGTGYRDWWPRGRSLLSCLASCLFHAALLVVLALVVEAARPGPTAGSLTATLVWRADPAARLDDPAELSSTLLDRKPLGDAAQASPSERLVVVLPGGGTGAAPDRSAMGQRLQTFQPADWLAPNGNFVGSGQGAAKSWSGRTPDGRARLTSIRGGTQASEEAVERGLWWLVAHQLDDGSWSFDHRKSPCGELCRNPGNVASTTGATAIALLPFLGAGHTHVAGEHQQTVRRGLYYLTGRALLTPNGADLQEGTMYAQGLAAIALCEAYGMTGDRQLKEVAQRAIDFIVYAQDKRGGGWRYTPGEPGDTTVTGWQLMALKSAQTAGLDVPSPTVFLAQRFLDQVQAEDGARYGYMDDQPRNTTTAIGLLCRMFTGWRRSQRALERGVAYLCDWGPSTEDIYYNYYATQVLFHWEGSDWDRWNRQMRDHLIATQATSSHESGSWYFERHGREGGRLYSTAMAVMTLEVYYRYMPLYTEVPLDE